MNEPSDTDTLAKIWCESPIGLATRLIVREEIERALNQGVELKPIVLKGSDLERTKILPGDPDYNVIEVKEINKQP